MSRSVQYRREISEACNWHQDQALNSTIFILYQTGPTGFLLKEENENKNFKEKDLCKHICWVLLKKFRVLRSDPLSWQLGLNEREINQIIRGDTAGQDQRIKTKILPKKLNSTDSATANSHSNEIEQRPITDSDVCPICQDEFLTKKLPVTFCKFGCGNNVHIRCMKVWADHQKSNGETQLKCPLCRENFCSFELLDQEYRNNALFKVEKQDLHYGLICNSCKSTPISGKCYKCTTCNEFYLCQACFNTDFHSQHSFVFREKINQKYHKASREHVGIIPSAIAQSLATRELNDEDYDLLLQIESRTNAINNAANNGYSQIPEKVVKSWPTEKVRDNSLLLNPGIQCRVCLRAFQPNQIVRKLPTCKHKFHVDCIDNWLIHSHPTCPIDGQVVWDPIVAQMDKEEKMLNKKNTKNDKSIKENETSGNKAKQEVPSLDLIINFRTCVIENKKALDDLKEANKRNESAPVKLKNLKMKNTRTSSLTSTENIKSNVKNNNQNSMLTTGLNLGLTSENLVDYLTSKVNVNIKPIALNRTQFPRIDNKNTNNPLSNLLTDEASLMKKPPVPAIQGTSYSSLVSEPCHDLFRVTSLPINKPYQLSRLPSTTSNPNALTNIKNSSSKPINSDFYSNESDDEYEANDFPEYKTDALSIITTTTQTDISNASNNHNNNLGRFQDELESNLNVKPNNRSVQVPGIKNSQSNQKRLRMHHPPVIKKTLDLTSNQKSNDIKDLPMVIGVKTSNMVHQNIGNYSHANDTFDLVDGFINNYIIDENYLIPPSTSIDQNNINSIDISNNE